jgi:hypothetical protein
MSDLLSSFGRLRCWIRCGFLLFSFLCLQPKLALGQTPLPENKCIDGNGDQISFPKFYNPEIDGFAFEDSPAADCEANSRGCKGVCKDAGTLYNNETCVYRSNMSQMGKDGLSCMERMTAVYSKRKPQWESAWRPPDYQEHFRDIWTGYKKVKFIDPVINPECAVLKNLYTREIMKHDMTRLGTRPAGRSGPHIQGLAVDMPEGSMPDRIILNGGHPTAKPTGEIVHLPPADNATPDYVWSSEEQYKVDVQYTDFPAEDGHGVLGYPHGPLRLCEAWIYQRLCTPIVPTPTCGAWDLKWKNSNWNTDCTAVTRDYIAEKCGMHRPLPVTDESHYKVNGY